MTKEQAQVIINDFLEGKVWVSLDFETEHNFELGQYTIKHDLQDEVEGLGIVYMTFPAQPHYAEALERYDAERTDESMWALKEIAESEFENIYDYENPLKIECESDRYDVINGKVI